MATFITRMIEQSAKISIAKGREKYETYFVKLKKKIYQSYRAEVDSALMDDGYGDCIVTG